MLIECEHCRVRGAACAGCVVPALLECPGSDPRGDPAGRVVDIDEDERRALRLLAEHELVPPLRLVPPPSPNVTSGRPHERAS